MKFKHCLAASAAVCGAAYFAMKGRTGHPDLHRLKNWNYAHRGLHCPGRPENSRMAFRAAVEQGYGSELDVHLLKDGGLAIIHDSKLKRTTGQEGRVEDLTVAELSDYYLEGTQETIPTLQQVLEIYDGNAPLIIELKPVEGNHAALCQAVCDTLEGYRGLYCLESFDPRCVMWLKNNRPKLIRGQLTEYFVESDPNMPAGLRFLLSHNLLNWMGRPDFVAYRFRHRNKSFTNRIWKEWMGIQGVTWTLQNEAEHAQALEEDLIPIFENYMP